MKYLMKLHVANFSPSYQLNCELKLSSQARCSSVRYPPDKMPTVGYSIPDEIPTTCFQLCELV